MKIDSLGHCTDLIFSKFSGSVTDKGSYTLVQTPSNPGFHWGNYIIFNRPPHSGDLSEWKALFDREFTYYEVPNHYAFSWSGQRIEKSQVQEFLDDGFEFTSNVVLSASTLHAPTHLNSEIKVRKILSDDQWQEVVELQTLCEDPKFLNERYEEFKRRQILSYKKMSEAGHGHWFGAYFENQLVGNLGIFYEGKLARYQQVGTHPNFRKRGICGTLVYKTGLIAMEEYDVQTLVMQADENYHAARIYRSVGFKKSEDLQFLSWWKK